MTGIVLDLCGGTGAWSRPYKEAGYDVRLITLPEYDVTQYGQAGDCIVFWGIMAVSAQEIPYKDIVGILAAPPCTEFSLAKNGSHRQRDLREGLRTLRACMEVIWLCLANGAPLKFWAVENPVGLMRRFMGKPAYTFRHWQFGAHLLKPTDIFGVFRPPSPTVKREPPDNLFDKLRHRYKSGKKPGNINSCAWKAPPVPEWYTGAKLDRAARRAITPDGFAEAFFRANR